jgi:hypothetical protein
MTNRDKLQIQINHLALDVFANIRILIEASKDNILKYDINGKWFSDSKTTTFNAKKENVRYFGMLVFNGNFTNVFDNNYLPQADEIVKKIIKGRKIWKLPIIMERILNYMIVQYEMLRTLKEPNYEIAKPIFNKRVASWRNEVTNSSPVFELIDEFYSNIKK